MSVHGWVALFLSVFFSLAAGIGLMALMFYSSRHGYASRPKRAILAGASCHEPRH